MTSGILEDMRSTLSVMLHPGRLNEGGMSLKSSWRFYWKSMLYIYVLINAIGIVAVPVLYHSGFGISFSSDYIIAMPLIAGVFAIALTVAYLVAGAVSHLICIALGQAGKGLGRTMAAMLYSSQPAMLFAALSNVLLGLGMTSAITPNLMGATGASLALNAAYAVARLLITYLITVPAVWGAAIYASALSRAQRISIRRGAAVAILTFLVFFVALPAVYGAAWAYTTFPHYPAKHLHSQGQGGSSAMVNLTSLYGMECPRLVLSGAGTQQNFTLGPPTGIPAGQYTYVVNGLAPNTPYSVSLLGETCSCCAPTMLDFLGAGCFDPRLYVYQSNSFVTSSSVPVSASLDISPYANALTAFQPRQGVNQTEYSYCYG